MTNDLNRNDIVEREPNMAFCGLQHILIAIRQDGEGMIHGQSPQRFNNIGKRLQPLNLTDQPTGFLLGILKLAAVHDVRYSTLANDTVGGMFART